MPSTLPSTTRRAVRQGERHDVPAPRTYAAGSIRLSVWRSVVDADDVALEQRDARSDRRSLPRPRRCAGRRTRRRWPDGRRSRRRRAAARDPRRARRERCPRPCRRCRTDRPSASPSAAATPDASASPAPVSSAKRYGPRPSTWASTKMCPSRNVNGTAAGGWARRPRPSAGDRATAAAHARATAAGSRRCGGAANALPLAPRRPAATCPSSRGTARVATSASP